MLGFWCGARVLAMRDPWSDEKSQKVFAPSPSESTRATCEQKRGCAQCEQKVWVVGVNGRCESTRLTIRAIISSTERSTDHRLEPTSPRV